MFQTNPFSLIVLFVGLSLLPFVAMMATSYLKIVVVMSLIRNALGIQSIPPNMVINALAMILTFYVMAPVASESWNAIVESQRQGSQPVQTQAVAAAPAESSTINLTSFDFPAAVEPFRKWLSNHTAPRERAFFINTAETLWGKDDNLAVVDPESFYILLPSFCVSELTKAFQIGFLVYLPFIAIDIIVSNILLAMGMMMVSPVTISLPFKLLLFVMVNGWTLLIQGLVRGYVL
ncbi:MAG: type III secretion system export apparatus subunit SctR [Kiritimatiellae bacterium]|jgi:type III secretion protein R|nr:type III secretion system export apparatus subunit SctR [Kiritimatiellia bacterium]MBR4613087.1 type III secretion system export apparatus subunit SctR [Kiritimatiellia bacterium]